MSLVNTWPVFRFNGEIETCVHGVLHGGTSHLPKICDILFEIDLPKAAIWHVQTFDRVNDSAQSCPEMIRDFLVIDSVHRCWSLRSK